MADTMAGLFGPTPDEVRAAQMQAYQQQAQQYGRMDPFQQANAGMFTSGARIGDLIARAMGGTNIAQQRAQQQQEAMQGADLQTPEGLRAVAKKMLDMGNQQLAIGLIDRANKLETELSDIALKKAHAKYYEQGGAAGKNRVDLYKTDKGQTIQRDNTTGKFYEAGTENEIDPATLAGMKLFKIGTEREAAVGTVKRMSTNIGEVIFEPATKKYTYGDGTEIPADKLRTMVPIGNDPTNAANVAQAKEGAKTIGASSAKAQEAIPDLETSLEQAQYLGQQLFAHPGFKGAVGMGIPEAMQASGTSEKGFMALHNQIVRSSFLQAAQQMRGLGQLTEVEGAKAEGAVNRMSVATSEADYRKAYDDYIKFMKMGLDKLHKKAGMSYQSPVFNTPQVSAPSPAAPMPQGAVPTTPVAPMPNTQPNFSGLTTPQQVKDQYKSGKITKQQANAILDDMKSRGLF